MYTGLSKVLTTSILLIACILVGMFEFIGLIRHFIISKGTKRHA